MNKNQKQILEEKWSNLSDTDKVFLLSLCNDLLPKKSKSINESQWYNTVGDILGIFDPTGVIDLANGISYINQGDYLFGFLSMISVIPYVGDVLAKPVMGAMKVGKPAVKTLDTALKLSKAGKSTEALGILKTLSAEKGVVGNFVRGSGQWTPKLKAAVDNVPGGVLTRRTRGVLGQWIDLFSQAGTKGKVLKAETGNLVKNWSKITDVQKIENIKNLRKLADGSSIFKGYKNANPTLWSGLAGGVPRIWGNRSVRSLMRRTKWYLGFLDFLGLGNWVGPEELDAKYGQEYVNQKVGEYSQTQQSQQYYNDEFGGQTPEGGQQPTGSEEISTPTELLTKNVSNPTVDPVGFLIKSLI
jgi:hypothetical protein